MIPVSNYRPHSARVSMRLLVNGSSLRIASMGPDGLLVDADSPHAPGPAVIWMQVDTSESQWAVYLPEGIAAGQMQPVVVTLPVGQAQRQSADVKKVFAQ